MTQNSRSICNNVNEAANTEDRTHEVALHMKVLFRFRHFHFSTERICDLWNIGLTSNFTYGFFENDTDSLETYPHTYAYAYIVHNNIYTHVFKHMMDNVKDIARATNTENGRTNPDEMFSRGFAEIFNKLDLSLRFPSIRAALSQTTDGWDQICVCFRSRWRFGGIEWIQCQELDNSREAKTRHGLWRQKKQWYDENR